MKEQFTRTERILGKDALNRLAGSHVAVFGLGGVGGYAAEALARSGIGTLTLVDHDSVSESNLNRQIYALHSTVGRLKTEVAEERIADINPDAAIHVLPLFFSEETADQFDFADYDYIIDAIDTVTGKLTLISQAKKFGTPIISAMGAGNKIHPDQLHVADLYETSVCPLARIMRRECRKRSIDHLKVVYSTEPPLAEMADDGSEEAPPGRRAIPGSTAFVPGAMGLLLASEVVNDLIKIS